MEYEGNIFLLSGRVFNFSNAKMIVRNGEMLIFKGNEVTKIPLSNIEYSTIRRENNE